MAVFSYIHQTGGVEHVLANFANAMLERGHDVTVLYAAPQEEKLPYAVKPQVRFRNLMQNKKFPHSKHYFLKAIPFHQRLVRKALFKTSRRRYKDWNFFCLNRMAGRAIQDELRTVRPDVIVSYNASTNGLIMKNNPSHIPTVTMFHIMPYVELEKNVSDYERNVLAKDAAVQVLLEDNVNYMHKVCPGANVKVIANAVQQCNSTVDYDKTGKHTILEVARLHKADKRQHVLIEAFALIADRYPDWNVELWGKESSPGYKQELTTLIHKKGLDDRVLLKGATREIQNVYLSADLCCFPSLVEGFGMAMAEAMACGVPVIAMKDCVASREILDGYDCGLLVDDNVSALADALSYMIEHPEKRREWGLNAKRRASDYAPEKIWDQWEELLTSVCQKDSKGALS